MRIPFPQLGLAPETAFVLLSVVIFLTNIFLKKVGGPSTYCCPRCGHWIKK